LQRIGPIQRVVFEELSGQLKGTGVSLGQFVSAWGQLSTVEKSSLILKGVGTALSDLGDKMLSAIPGIQALDKVLEKFGLSVAGIASFALPAAFFSAMAEGINESIKFEHSLVDLRMNTDLTKEEVDKFGESLLGVSTDTGIASEELAHISGELIRLQP